MLHLVMVLVLRKNSGLIALLELINRKISFTFSWSSSWSRGLTFVSTLFWSWFLLIAMLFISLFLISYDEQKCKEFGVSSNYVDK